MAVELTDSAAQKLREARSQGKIGPGRKTTTKPRPKPATTVANIKSRADAAAQARLAADRANGITRR